MSVNNMEALEKISPTFRQRNETSLEDRPELLRSMNGDQNARLNEFTKKWKICLHNLLKATADSCLNKTNNKIKYEEGDISAERRVRTGAECP